jgi:hypothetical protein
MHSFVIYGAQNDHGIVVEDTIYLEKFPPSLNVHSFIAFDLTVGENGSPSRSIIRTKPLSVQENMGILLLAFLFLIMLFWKVRPTWHHAANSDDLVASNSFSASQAEALEVEILLSNQGSRIVSMEKSSIVYSFLVRAHNLQILRIEQGSTPRIDQSFLLRFSLLLSPT